MNLKKEKKVRKYDVKNVICNSSNKTRSFSNTITNKYRYSLNATLKRLKLTFKAML